MNNIITKRDERFYIINGVPYPRVTWILSAYPKGEGFSRWMGSQSSYEDSQRVMEQAGKRGTHVHVGIEKLIAGEVLSFDDYTEEEWDMLSAFAGWVEKYRPQFVSNEKTVHSERYEFAGTLDALCVIDDVLTIIDWKTSSAIYESYWLQTAAYTHALYEMKLLKRNDEVQTAILRLGSKHKCGYEYQTHDNWKRDFEDFLSVQHIFNRENPNLKPVIKEYKATLSLN